MEVEEIEHIDIKGQSGTTKWEKLRVKLSRQRGRRIHNSEDLFDKNNKTYYCTHTHTYTCTKQKQLQKKLK